jgi:hypothetical protein
MLSQDLAALEVNATARTQFLNAPMTNSATDIIANACSQWQIDPEEYTKYCLIFDDTKNYLSEGKKKK